MTHVEEFSIHERAVRIPLDGIALDGELWTPSHARGLVIFAHGGGSARLSPRDRSVAAELQRAHLATLLLDLLTPDEERSDGDAARFRFDVARLAVRLEAATHWAAHDPETQRLPVGYFGASTGAAAALAAAGRLGPRVHAVVSRGGRPDLAGEWLARVRAPTLLVVGAYDTIALDMNRDALRALRCPKRLEIVPRATHLFEEAGALEQVTALARHWFARHLALRPRRPLAATDGW